MACTDAAPSSPAWPPAWMNRCDCRPRSCLSITAIPPLRPPLSIRTAAPEDNLNRPARPMPDAGSLGSATITGQSRIVREQRALEIVHQMRERHDPIAHPQNARRQAERPLGLDSTPARAR